jgi:hypothetical protein
MMKASVSQWWRIALLGAALLGSAGCALDMPKAEAEKVAKESLPRPEWRLGDRWTFKRTSFTGVASVVTHQVVEATAEGYTIRTQGVVPEVTRRWTLDLHLVEETAADGTFMRYDPPALYFSWPFKPGDTWAQEFQYVDGRNDGRYANTWKVGAGVEPIDTVTGRFYTLRIERWGGPRRLEAYWYNPRIRYWVRLEDYLRGYQEELVDVRSWSGS